MTTHHRGDNNALVTLGIFVSTAVLIAIILIAGRPRQTKIAVSTPRPTPTTTPPPTPAPLVIYVTGAVANPNQRHTLPAESRVSDAIAAAGGALATADLSRVNLADRLQDGAQIHVPEAAAPAGSPLPTPVGGAKIAINHADAETLDTLPGIGPALAQRIVDHRTAHGPFTSIEALGAVSGIGSALLESLRDLVSFD